jgi:hypothetical protein
MTAIDVQRLLGLAAFKQWSQLPRDVQELLFETAAPFDEPDILHEHHPKTAHLLA